MASRKELLAKLKLDPATKPIRATIKLQNNCLRARRVALGLTTHEIARKVGISYGTYIRLESMKDNPLSVREGEAWKRAAVLLAKFYQVLPENLFPSVVLAVEKSTTEREFDEEEIQALLPDYMRRQALGPEEIMAQNQLRGTVTKVLGLLKPIEQEVVKRHYGLDSGTGRNLTQVGKEIGRSVTRVSQIHDRAIGKLGSVIPTMMQRPPLAPNVLGWGIRCIHHNLGRINRYPDDDIPLLMDVVLDLPDPVSGSAAEYLQFEGREVWELIRAADTSSLSTHPRLLKIDIVDRKGNILRRKEGPGGEWERISVGATRESGAGQV